MTTMSLITGKKWTRRLLLCSMLSTAVRRWVQGSRCYRALTSSSVTSRSRSVYVEYAKPQAQEALKPRILITGRRRRRLTVQLWNVWNYKAENFEALQCFLNTGPLISQPVRQPLSPSKVYQRLSPRPELKTAQTFRLLFISKFYRVKQYKIWSRFSTPVTHLSRPGFERERSITDMIHSYMQLRWLAWCYPYVLCSSIHSSVRTRGNKCFVSNPAGKVCFRSGSKCSLTLSLVRLVLLLRTCCLNTLLFRWFYSANKAIDHQ